MKSVPYTSTQYLSCAKCAGEVIICIDPAKTVTGFPYIIGIVAAVDCWTDSCGVLQYVYGFTYDEGQLLDPNTDLVDTDIHGLFCKGCLTDYIDAKNKENVCDSELTNVGSLVVCDEGVPAILTGLPGQVPVLIDPNTGEVEFQDIGNSNPCLNSFASEGTLLICNNDTTATLEPSQIGQVPVCVDAGTGAVQFQTLTLAPITTSKIVFCIGNGSDVITTGIKKAIEVTQNCTITGWKILSDDPSTTAGDIVIDVWRKAYGSGYPPLVGNTLIDTIGGGIKPTVVASATSAASVSMAHWTTSLLAGDILRFNVDSVHLFTNITLILEVTLT